MMEEESSEGFPGMHFESLEEEELYFITNMVGAAVTLFGVAVIAGIFLGVMTLDPLDLQIKERSSLDPDERKYARALYPIVQDRHLFLCTILVCNAIAYEALPIFLDKLVPAWLAVVLSTTLVLLFGEIIPSGIFTGPNQLKLGYYMVPLVKVLQVVAYPIAKPLSMLLDYIVGDEPEPEEAYNRGELAALIKIQYEERLKKHPRLLHNKNTVRWERPQMNNPLIKQPGHNDTYHALKKELMLAVNENMEDEVDLEHNLRPPMEPEEVNIVLGALQLKTKVTMDVYTPLRHVYSVSDDTILTKDNIAKIYGKGFSRVPVYKAGTKSDDGTSMTVCGFVLTRQLILIDWEDEREVKSLPLYFPMAVSPRMNLVRLLHILRQGGSHMALVCARPDLANRSLQNEQPIPIEAGLIGIVTLEDIMEAILQQRIYDETDLRDRELALLTLQTWAAATLQRCFRKRKRRTHSLTRTQPSSKSQRTDNGDEDKPPNKAQRTNSFGKHAHLSDENTPLLGV